ncbi:MAG: hypothetical protein KAR21_01435 [Spirochaetales bacterium]|nr:hypothetical protein [Spirochaetales bacterium]
MEKACKNSGTKAARFILSDNGKPLCCSDYEALLKRLEIGDKKIPPGKPWFNGALESGNRDLKKTLYTVLAYNACKKPGISKPENNRNEILEFLKISCNEAKNLINNKIVRVKFKTTPVNVLNGKVLEKQIESNEYIAIKKLERKNRIKDIKEGRIKRSNKTFFGTTNAKSGKLLSSLTIEKLFAFTELINGRTAFVKC